MRKLRITICSVALLALAASTHAEGFTLTGSQHLDVTTSYDYGYLYESSTASILTGGNVLTTLFVNDEAKLNISYGSANMLHTYNNSTLDMSGGNISNYLSSLDSSTVNISNASVVNWLYATNTSTVNISGGTFTHQSYAYNNSIMNISGGIFNDAFTAYNDSKINFSGGNMINSLRAIDSSVVNISGGTIVSLHANNTSNVIFEGYDFILGQGLSWDIDGQTILGTGTLTGKWFNNTSFVIPIQYHDTTATIMAIPEPATLALLSLASLVMIKKRKA